MASQATSETTALLAPVVDGSAIITAQSVVNDGDAETTKYPKGIRFATIFGCVLLGDFLVGYDTSCVTTLTPVISDEYHSIGDVSWYEMSYILALISTILVFGQSYTIFSLRSVFLTSFFIFCLGSVLCTTAPSSVIFIIGRAITGCGGAGIFSGGNIIVSQITPIHSRPTYLGIAGSVECAALAFGPILAGAVAHFTGSWRLSFLITIPACLIIATAIITFMRGLPQNSEAAARNERWHSKLDTAGVLLFVPGSTLLLLSLQLFGGSSGGGGGGGSTAHAWNDVRILGCFGGAVILLALFLVEQKWAGDRAMVPLRLLRNRTVALSSLTMAFMSGSLWVFGFYLPIYFQALRGADTLTSGLMYLPSAITLAVAPFAAGHITSSIGYYTPLMALGSLSATLGASLITARFNLSTPPYEWILYQFLYNLGCGLGFQQPYIAIQAVLEHEPEPVREPEPEPGQSQDPIQSQDQSQRKKNKVTVTKEDIPIAIVVISFVQQLGGVLALAVAQAVFIGRLLARLTAGGKDGDTGVDLGLTARDVLDRGAKEVIDGVKDPEVRELVRRMYMDSMRDVFVVGLVCAVGTVVALGVPWRSVKEGSSKDKVVDGEEEE